MDDLAEELEFHRAAHQARLEQDGWHVADAARESRRVMGNVTLALEDSRAVWLAPWIESVWKDAAYGLRMLRREPGSSCLAIAALTVAIGLNTSLFTVYTALAMKPWAGVREPHRVVRVINQSTRDLQTRAGGGPGGFSQAEVDYFARTARMCSGFVLLGRDVDVRVGDADVRASWVGGTYFSVLGVEMAAGRGFTDDEDRVEAPRAVAVISHGLWRRQFGASPDVIGRDIRLDDEPFTIVGVTSARFLGTEPDRIDVWLPRAAASLLRPADRWVTNVAQRPANCCSPVAARLAPGITPAQAAAELSALSRAFRAHMPDVSAGVSVAGTEALATPKGNGGGDVFLPLAAAMVVVLLLACANVGNLLLARGATRGREISVRLSLGAGRGRVLRQLLTESLVLAAIAGAGGVLLASWLPARIVALASASPLALQLEPDRGVLAFTATIALLSCLLFGLAPALHASRRSLAHAATNHVSRSGLRFSLRTLLVSVQVAAVVVLLISAGVLVRSGARASDRALPGQLRDVMSVDIQAPVRGYDAARTRATSMQIADAIVHASLPRQPLALTSTAPLGSGNIKGSFRVDGSDEDRYNAVFEVSPGYFHVMAMPIVDGRDFTEADSGHQVIVVNETMARQYWPSHRAVGQRISVVPPHGGWNMPGELEIIGVVRDAYLTSVDGIDPTIFQPLTHRTIPQVVAGNAAAGAEAMERVARVDAGLRLRMRSLADHLAPRLRSARLAATIAASLGGLALALACVGLFGVVAYWVRQRTHEIGIRMALGAPSGEVLALVLGTTLRAVLLGIVVGLAISIWTARLLKGFLFGLTAIDPLTYAIVTLVLLTATLVAALVPARRATRIDPLVALRHE